MSEGVQMEQQGDIPVDVAERLAALDDQPVEEHVPAYDALHRELRDQLVGKPDEDAPRPQP